MEDLDGLNRGLNDTLEPSMKTYRYHYCGARHRSYDTIAKCLWPKAVYVAGYADGAYATLSKCRNPYEPSVVLHATVQEALDAKDFIDRLACGGRCCRNHEVVKLTSPEEIVARPELKRVRQTRRARRGY